MTQLFDKGRQAMNQSIRNLFLTFTLMFLFFALIVIGSFEAMAKPISFAPDHGDFCTKPRKGIFQKLSTREDNIAK